MTATWQTNVLVAATPISSPARVNSTPSASRVACEPVAFVTASTVAPRSRARRIAASVSAVSPGLRDTDHEVARADDGVSIAVLGGDVDLDGHARPLLDRIAPDQPGVIGGPAGDDHDPPDVCQHAIVQRPLVGEAHVSRPPCDRRSFPRRRRPVRGSP